MNDFDFDVMQKKRIANNAARMKRGSKSKKCSLPSDHLTPAQWKRRNGPVMTVSMNKPMSWKNFKDMPLDLQQTYIDAIQNRFGVPVTQISIELFGNSTHALRAHCNRYGVKFRTMAGKNLSPEEKELWENWCKGNSTEKCEESHENVVEKCEMLPEEPEIPVEMSEKPEALIEMANKKLDVNTIIDQMFNYPEVEVKKTLKFDLDELSAVFSGEFNPERFLRFVNQLPVPEGNVRIKVEVTKV
jgi:hypothetical protein